MKRAVMILTTAIMTACNVQRKETSNEYVQDETQYLCILKETGGEITYLISLTRIVRKAGDELLSYAGGDELFYATKRRQY